MSEQEHDLQMEIGDVGNYYGGLVVVKHVDGTYSWSITNYDGDHFLKIPACLGEALWSYETERSK